MQIFESGGALAVRRSAMLWRKLAAVLAVSTAAITVSPAIAVYLLLVN